MLKFLVEVFRGKAQFRQAMLTYDLQQLLLFMKAYIMDTMYLVAVAWKGTSNEYT